MQNFSPKEKPLDAFSFIDKAKTNGWLVTPSDTIIADAFSVKKAVHAGMTGTPLSQETIQKELDGLLSQKRQGPSAAYVHIPYCESKCLYCGFFGGKYTPRAGKTYLDALLLEIESASQFTATNDTPIQALYLGGGTPTALAAEELSLLLNTLRATLPLSNDCEITVEGRIHNFGEAKMEACIAAGANRFSLGVQTFDTGLRQMLGRIEPKDTVIKALTTLASYNQAAIVIDLIYGLPGQTVQDWKDDVQTFLDLPLDGVDLYQLNVFPGSALEKSIASGKIPPTVPLHQQGGHFLAGIELMQSARAKRLSLCHWGRTTRERNFYNVLAKTRADCLNFGVRTGGALHGYFIANEANAETYIARCIQGEKPVGMLIGPPATLPLVRSILGQMEECRLNMNTLSHIMAQTAFAQSFSNAREFFAPLLENWEQAGLVTFDKEWVELTLAGQFWQVNLTHALLGWQNLIYQELS